MKKRVIIVLCILAAAVIAIAVFTKKDASEEIPSTSDTGTSLQETTEDNTPEIQNGTKNPDKLVRVTLPLALYDATKKADTSGFIHKGNYEKIEVNEKNKTFTATMKSLPYDFMLSNVGLQVIQNIVTLLDNEDYPYIRSLGRYNADFSEIELVVDGEKYSNAKNTADIGPFVASCGVFYQLYSTENKYKCKVIITNESDKTVLDEYSVQYNNSNLY